MIADYFIRIPFDRPFCSRPLLAQLIMFGDSENEKKVRTMRDLNEVEPLLDGIEE